MFHAIINECTYFSNTLFIKHKNLCCNCFGVLNVGTLTVSWGGVKKSILNLIGCMVLTDSEVDDSECIIMLSSLCVIITSGLWSNEITMISL